jgi:hypothetical protein
VILVDDLDRLRTTEILEVLKLLRNTADFHNLIFVVAMDKEYVVRRLKDQGEISNARFIDKFFQLEFYLPEIRKENLQEEFKKQVANTIFSSDIQLENAFDEAMASTYNLFADYCRNYRDVKRLVNQVRLEYPILGKEINLKDFINITCFKVRFPQVVNYVYRNRSDVLKIDVHKGLFYLEENISYETQHVVDNSFESQSDADSSVFEKYISTKEIANQYVIFTSESKMNIDWIAQLWVDKNEYPLLIKSLAYLFGRENTIDGTDSIKYENNFRLFMQQRMDEILLTNDEFRDFIYEKNTDRLLINLNGKSNESLVQLFERLALFHTRDEKELLNAIFLIAYLWDRLTEDNYLQLDQLSEKLADFLNTLFKVKHNLSIIDKVEEQTFANKRINPVTRTKLLTGLYRVSKVTGWWDRKKNNFSKYGLEAFTDYLSDHNEKTWAYNDISWMIFYDNLKLIPGLQPKLNEAFKNFWKHRDMEVLSVQLIEANVRSPQLFYLHKIIPQIFGSFQDFMSFVEQNKFHFNQDLYDIYQRFLKLASITYFEFEIIFNFKRWPLMQEKIAEIKKTGEGLQKDELEGQIQLFFETDDHEIYQNFKGSELIKEYSGQRLLFIMHEDFYYIIVSPKYFNSTPEHFMTYTNILCQVAQDANWQILDKTEAQIKNGEAFIIKPRWENNVRVESDAYVKLISYQP